jgi:anti-sigma B factor antagonist
MAFQVEPTGDHGFRLVGELDMAAADVLSQHVEEVLPDGRDVRLDLSELTFIDSSGIHALVTLGKRMSNGGRIVIERPRGQAAKVFAVIGADRLSTLEIRTEDPSRL